MASQYKLLYRSPNTAPAGQSIQAVIGRGRIRMASLVSFVAAPNLVTMRDENPEVVGSPTTTPIASIQVTSNPGFKEQHFDDADGGLSFTNGLHLTFDATFDGYLYIYS